MFSADQELKTALLQLLVQPVEQCKQPQPTLGPLLGAANDELYQEHERAVYLASFRIKRQWGIANKPWDDFCKDVNAVGASLSMPTTNPLVANCTMMASPAGLYYDKAYQAYLKAISWHAEPERGIFGQKSGKNAYKVVEVSAAINLSDAALREFQDGFGDPGRCALFWEAATATRNGMCWAWTADSFLDGEKGRVRGNNTKHTSSNFVPLHLGAASLSSPCRSGWTSALRCRR